MTIFVEDLVAHEYSLVLSSKIVDAWRVNFISNVYSRVYHGTALTTNQGSIVLKTAKEYKHDLAKVIGVPLQDIEWAIANPQYKKQVRASLNIPREVRYLGENKLAFRFKRDDTLILEIKALKSSDLTEDKSEWNQDLKIWIVTVSAGNIDRVMEMINKHRFEFDDAVLEFITRCFNAKKAPQVFKYDEASGDLLATINSNPLLDEIVKFTMGGQAL